MCRQSHALARAWISLGPPSRGGYVAPESRSTVTLRKAPCTPGATVQRGEAEIGLQGISLEREEHSYSTSAIPIVAFAYHRKPQISPPHAIKANLARSHACVARSKHPTQVTTMSLKRNVVANYLGQGWQALMGLAFIPLYIRYLGIEAYGLIGIFALLQAWLGLLDMGMKPALGREMARFTGGAHNAQSIRDLLRSIELIGIAIAGGVALGIWAASGWLATHWVTAKNLPMEVVAHAFAVMGVVTALRFIESIYVSSIVGLQRQVLQNIVTSITATVRGLGAVALLVWVSPTIGAFFLWQGLLSMITVALYAGIVYRALPSAPLPARFSGSALVNIRRFAAGVVAITFLALLLTQVDKIRLSRLLTLEAFGYYALAGVVANALFMLTGPITTALYPRFTELATNGDEVALRAVYHQGAQVVTG